MNDLLLDMVVLTEGGLSYSELAGMPFPDVEALREHAVRLSKRLKAAAKAT